MTDARAAAMEAAADAIGAAWDTDEDGDERMRVYARAATLERALELANDGTRT